MPSCIFSGESAKLDAEQRQQQAEDEVVEEPEHPYSNIVANNDASKGKTTSPTQLAIQPARSSQKSDEIDTVISRSLETQNDDSKFDQRVSGQLNDNQPISFEIHEESDNKLTDNQPISGHFGTWSSCASTERSHVLYFLILLCISRLFDRILL